jgi:hypothetical protein
MDGKEALFPVDVQICVIFLKDLGTVPNYVGTIFSFHLMWEMWPLLMDGK